MKYTFKVIGKIKSKSRPRFNTKTGKAFKVKADRSYENLIRQSFIDAGGEMLNGYIKMDVKAFYKITKEDRKNTPKNNKNREAKLNGTVRPGKMDLDNVLKNVLDACNKFCFEDDIAVVELSSSKYYTDEEEDYLIITIEEI